MLRASARLVVLAGLVAVLYATWFAGHVVLTGSDARRRAWRRRLVRVWARAVGRIAGMRLDVRGTPPQPPFLLVSNHLGYFDIVALSSAVDCTYVARGDLARWPVIGAMCRAADIIFTDRSRRRDIVPTSEQIAKALASGDGVVLFAEGTSTDGSAVAPFKPSLLEPAVTEGRPVHYASLGYRTEPGEAPARTAVCWWGDMAFPGHLWGLLGLRGFDATVAFGGEPIGEPDRKLLAVRLHEAVEGQFTPLE